jgi:hypothetical protein
MPDASEVLSIGGPGSYLENFSGRGNYYHANWSYEADNPFIFNWQWFGMGDAITHARRSGAHRGAFEDLTARDPVESASLHFWRKAQVRTD